MTAAGGALLAVLRRGRVDEAVGAGALLAVRLARERRRGMWAVVMEWWCNEVWCGCGGQQAGRAGQECVGSTKLLPARPLGRKQQGCGWAGWDGGTVSGVVRAGGGGVEVGVEVRVGEAVVSRVAPQLGEEVAVDGGSATYIPGSIAMAFVPVVSCVRLVVIGAEAP